MDESNFSRVLKYPFQDEVFPIVIKNSRRGREDFHIVRHMGVRQFRARFSLAKTTKGITFSAEI